jgi:DNA-directed RNA polymerase subunit K/omega
MSDDEYFEFVIESEGEESEDESSSDSDVLIDEDGLEEEANNVQEVVDINVSFHPYVCTQQVLTTLVSERAKQLAKGMPPLIPMRDVKELRYNNIYIAEKEIKDGLVNFVVRYTNPSGEIVEVESNTLIF